jgi:segregation and condensation protein A
VNAGSDQPDDTPEPGAVPPSGDDAAPSVPASGSPEPAGDAAGASGGDPEDARVRLEALRAEHASRQEEMPFAIVEGRAVTELPRDLYIPPDALEVFLEAFEGPLDLLLYLIRRQNLDILDISVSRITHQYMQYVELMKALQFELAAEYLVMAAMLAEIKSRMLLPRPPMEEGEEGEDPRAELIRRLQEYERFKQAAEDLDELPRVDREVFPGTAKAPPMDRQRPQADVDLKELLVALAEVVQRAENFASHNVSFEMLSTRERMGEVLRRVTDRADFVDFHSLFRVDEGRLGVIVTFLAIMELVKESLIEIVQNEPFAPIHVRARIHEPGEGPAVDEDSDAPDDESPYETPEDDER